VLEGTVHEIRVLLVSCWFDGVYSDVLRCWGIFTHGFIHINRQKHKTKINYLIRLRVRAEIVNEK